MKKPIEGEEEVKELVRKFYDKVLKNETLAPMFSHALHAHWDQHLHAMDQFWMNILFYKGEYKGNPMDTHKQLHYLSRLQPDHFNIWLQLFHQTIDELFTGEKAELAIQRANAISTVMIEKIIEPPKKP